MKASQELRIMADSLENIKSDDTLKAKEVWDLINGIQEELLNIIYSDRLFDK